MKVGDLVRLKSLRTRRGRQFGLVIDIDHHPLNAAPVKVQWLESGYIQYRNMNELEVISENR